jgi:prevent-host-death family protein
MSTVSIEQAQAQLPDLIHRLVPGEEVLITENNRPVARLVPTIVAAERRLGTLQGTVLYMAPDFDAPLEDFREYSE